MAGMGVGLITIFILGAVILALIVNLFIKLPPPKKQQMFSSTRKHLLNGMTYSVPISLRVSSSLFTSSTSSKKIKIGIPIIRPHIPKKCSEKIRTINV